MSHYNLISIPFLYELVNNLHFIISGDLKDVYHPSLKLSYYLDKFNLLNH